MGHKAHWMLHCAAKLGLEAKAAARGPGAKFGKEGRNGKDEAEDVIADEGGSKGGCCIGCFCFLFLLDAVMDDANEEAIVLAMAEGEEVAEMGKSMMTSGCCCCCCCCCCLNSAF